MSNITSNAALTDAQSQNDISRNVRQHRDLDLFFSRKNGTNDIETITDVEAVKRSVRNLVLTNFYEKPFHPEIGSGIRGLLFEPMSPLTSLALQRKVEEVLLNFEPRISLVQVLSNANIDRNSYDLKIMFYVIGSEEPVEVETFLERLR